MKWPLIPLGKLVTSAGGGTPSRQQEEYFKGDIPWASIKDLGLDDYYLESTKESITKQALDQSLSHLVPAGTVILSTRIVVGKVVINQMDTAINQDLRALYCSELILPQYLLFYLKSIASDISAQATGSTIKGITVKQVEAWQIPLPSISEQQRIVEILEQALRLRNKSLQGEVFIDRLKPSIFNDFFGNPLTNPHHFEVASFSEVAKRQRTYVDVNMETFSELPYLSGKHIVNDGADLLNHLIVKESQLNKKRQLFSEEQILLLSTFSSNATQAVYPKFKGLCSDAITPITITSPSISHIYLTSLLQSKSFYDYISQYSQGTMLTRINKKMLDKYPVMIPPLELQMRYAKRLEALSSIKQRRDQSKTQFNKLLRVLLKKAFSNELISEWQKKNIESITQERNAQKQHLLNI